MRRVTVAVGVFLGLHVLLAYWRPVSLWGVGFLGYMPPWAILLFVVPGLCLLVPAARELLMSRVARVGRVLSPWQNDPRSHVGHGAVVLGGVLIFTAFRSAVPLLGDGQMLLLELDDLWGVERIDRAPLAYWLIRRMDRLGRGVWGSPEMTYRIFSYASGVLYLGISVPVSRVLGRNPLERTVVLGFLVTGGFLQLFFGYVENYAALLPGMLLYLLVGFLAVSKRLPLLFPAVILGLLIPLHLSLTSLVPSLLFLPFLRNGVSVSHLRSAMEALLLGSVSAVLALGILLLLGFDILSPVGRLQTSPILPLALNAGAEHHYSMFSPVHFLELANQFLLTAPAAVIVLAVCSARRYVRDRVHSFALVCGVFPVLATAIANPTIGAFRDWDVAAFSALPLTIWAALVLVEQAGTARRLRQIAFQIGAAAALHTAAWVGVNANAQWAEARFADLLERSQLAGHARSAGWETLGAHRHHEGRMRAAAEAYEKVVQAEPTFAPAHYNLGNIYRDLQDDVRSIASYRNAIALRPDLADAHQNLATVYFDRGEIDRAAGHFERAASLGPKRLDAHWGLGNARFGSGNYEAAIASYDQVVELDPSFVEAYHRAGDACYRLGRYEQSIRYYERSLLAGPDIAVAYSNIGNNYFGMANYQEAIDNFQRAVRLDPDFVDAYYNMGAAYHSLGRSGKARDCFRRVLELDPAFPQAPALREWLDHNPRQ